MGPIRRAIAEAVKRSGKTQQEIASEADMCVQHVNAIVCDRAGIGLERLERLCRVLDLELKPKRHANEKTDIRVYRGPQFGKRKSKLLRDLTERV